MKKILITASFMLLSLNAFAQGGHEGNHGPKKVVIVCEDDSLLNCHEFIRGNISASEATGLSVTETAIGAEGNEASVDSAGGAEGN